MRPVAAIKAVFQKILFWMISFYFRAMVEKSVRSRLGNLLLKISRGPYLPYTVIDIVFFHRPF